MVLRFARLSAVGLFSPKNLKIMIQRIQTIWLALAGACLAGLFFVPNEFISVVSTAAEGSVPTNFYSNLAAPIMLGLAMVASFGAIFLFGARKSQLSVVKLALIDTLLFMVIAGLMTYVDLQKNTNAPMIQYGWAIGLPVAAMVFQFLAFRAIQSDENLVQSAERLR